MSSFKWHPDDQPPVIEAHSKAKLEVLRRYLRAYFDRLNVNPQREQFKLDLIDGFAGGGAFLDEGNVVLSGSPLVMLEEAGSAQKRLNEKRKKQFHLDCKFYFVEKEKAHADHLQKVLAERGYDLDDGRGDGRGDGRIVLRNRCFENELENILRSIRQRQPRAGRAIFLLDQTGFSQVALELVSRIFSELPAAEVILTFAADALVNHLPEDPQIVRPISPLQLTGEQLHDLIQYRGGDGGRALVQRVLRDHVRCVTCATYDTPFFIRPGQSRRALWLLHLSRHPVARDVMIQRHWKIKNTFEHYGSGYGLGNFGMLGWDALEDPENLPLFQFNEIDRKQMKNQILESLPRDLFEFVSEQPITMDALWRELANRTAARFSDLEEVILELVAEREFSIIGPEGKERSRSLKHVQLTDRIAMPSTRLFPEFSRRSRSPGKIREGTADGDSSGKRASFRSLAARLRRRTEGRAQTPSEILIREERERGRRVD